jgi:hypothetical protein
MAADTVGDHEEPELGEDGERVLVPGAAPARVGAAGGLDA